SPFQSPSPAKTRTSARSSRAHGHHLRPSTNCDKLSGKIYPQPTGTRPTQFFTDEYNIYHFTKADYDHRTVNHGAGEYARRDPDDTCVHCNTMEGIWAGLRNFLDRFKGISQRFLHLRVARYEFLHNHGHLHWRQTFEAVLRSIFSTTGEYWRRMAHQHRRMPLTLSYR